ncbi:AAA family ATPase [Mucilaginibacter sp. ZT4R22]|uniref:AAA family ATPase n=1 Tax=Mucilaginibacter pankratovii TaxID=2772110 RepID=A0ABR7WIN7_9SPHI|nr:AAA family ATPase [Mucilaginibacter pankratovii]MBD1362201.1 AAA family ATPase [Mucilaginibacter pankratovii]
MSIPLRNIHITNFKSLKDCKIKACKRINLFIGKPNVGKSNILEALSIFSLPFLAESKIRSIKNLVRAQSEPELFYKGNFAETAHIVADGCHAKLHYHRVLGLSVLLDMPGVSQNYLIDEHLNLRTIKKENGKSFIRKYSFSNNVDFKRGHARYLIPPYGPNLLTVIEQDEALLSEISSWFEEYGLSLVFDKASQTLKILQSEKGKNEIFLVPYNSIADTLQRMIFFKTAIASNTNSVLLFEEPEAHSFPPFISKITQEMIFKTDNQYFIATHSPFLLNDFLENARGELAVYMVDYAKHETKVKLLTDDQLHQIYQNGVDLFTNSESYI